MRPSRDSTPPQHQRTACTGPRIAFDHQAFCRRPYTGISRYVTRLAEELARLGGIEARIIAPWHVNRFLHASPVGHQAGRFLPWHPRLARPLIRHLSAISARRRIRQWRPDLVHETYYQSFSSAPPGTPVVLTVHDMLHERYPGQFLFHQRTVRDKALAINRADMLICVSQATADELRHVFPDTENRIRVIHHGVDMPQSAASEQDHDAQDRPFFLYVGERSAYKNFATLATAFAQSSPLRRDFHLVCCGGGAFSREERDALSRLGIWDAVRHLTPSDRQLDALYRQATALVYPSINEGFGLPLLEAMARGCPVLASTAPALREVAGPAACFFEPTDSEALRSALEEIAHAPGLARQLRDAGRARAQSFSWQRCARETVACYREIL